MDRYICKNYPEGMQEATPHRSKPDTGDEKLPFNGRHVEPSSSLSFDVTNRASNTRRTSTVRGGHYRGYSNNLKLESREPSYIALVPKKKATSNINKSDNSSAQSSSGMDRVDSHSSTNQYKSSSRKSVRHQINNTESHSHPNLLPVPRSFASIVGQSEELLNKKQTDKINDHSASMNKNDGPDSSIEKTESKQKLSRIQIDDSNDTCNHELLLTLFDYSICKEKEADVFDEWLERVKAVNTQSVIMPSYGIKESDIAVALKEIKIAPSDRMKVIENLACWAERFEFCYLERLVTIFYSLVRADIFLWPQHTMTHNEIKFMKTLLSILNSKYAMRDNMITSRSISNTLWGLAKLADKSDALFTNIDKILPKLLMLICEFEIEKSHQHISNSLSAIIKLVLNKMIRIDIKDNNTTNAINRLLYHVTLSAGTFNDLSLNSLMNVITKLILLKIEDMQSIMNAFNALLPFIVPLTKASVTPFSLCKVLSAIVLVIKNNDGNMKIPDNIDITKDIIEPLVCCVNKDLGHQVNGYDLSVLLRDISSFKDMGLLTQQNIFDPAVLLITHLPRVAKEFEISLPDISFLMFNAGKIVSPSMISIKAVADSLPPMLAIVHDRSKSFAIKEISRVLFYLNKMAKNGMSWNIKYDDLINDLLDNVYKNRDKLTIIDACFITECLSELLSFGLIGGQSETFIKCIKNTLLPFIVEQQKCIDKSKIIHLLWSFAILGECIEVPQSLLLYFINTGIVDSLSQSSHVSKMLWGLTYFYIQPTISKKLKRVLKKSMNILFETLGSILKKRNEYEKKELGVYTRTYILAACWLNIYVDIDVLTSYYDAAETQSSRRQIELLGKMKRFFNDEIIESEKGAKGFSELDILLQKYMFGIEVEGPSHYSDYPNKQRVGSTIMKLYTYYKLGYTVIEVPVLDITNNKKMDELYQKIKQHIIKWNQPIGLNMNNMFDILFDEPTD